MCSDVYLFISRLIYIGWDLVVSHCCFRFGIASGIICFSFIFWLFFFFLVKCLCPLLNCSTRHLARAEWNVRSSWNRFSNWDWIDARTGLSEPTTKQVHTHTSALAAPPPPHHHLIRHHARAAPEVKCSKHDFALSLSALHSSFFLSVGAFLSTHLYPLRGVISF